MQNRSPQLGRCAGSGGSFGTLRKQREPPFDGDVDFIPTDRYSKEGATRAMEAASLAVEMPTSTITGA